MKTPFITAYLPRRDVEGIFKSASMEPPPEDTPVKEPKPDWGHRAKIVGSGLLGMGVGTLAGFGAMELADRAHGPSGLPASVLNKAVPLAGAGAGVMYSLWKAREMEKLRHAVKPSSDDQP